MAIAMHIVASSRREPARESNERETIMTTTDRPAADGVLSLFCLNHRLFFASTTEGNRGQEKVFKWLVVQVARKWLVLGVSDEVPR
jgi:hypothetical protein